MKAIVKPADNYKVLMGKYEHASVSNYTQDETGKRFAKIVRAVPSFKMVDVKQTGVGIKNSKMVWGMMKNGLYRWYIPKQQAIYTRN